MSWANSATSFATAPILCCRAKTPRLRFNSSAGWKNSEASSLCCGRFPEAETTVIRKPKLRNQGVKVEPYSQAIARFLWVEARRRAAGVVDKAKYSDTLVLRWPSTMDFGRMVMNVAQNWGRSASRLIGSPLKVAAANAVLANGTLAHGLDYDDTLEEAIVHTGCCAGMTALAVGEELGASGKAVLEAAIAGTEVMCKVGLVAPGKFRAGLSSTALCSTRGAALRPANSMVSIGPVERCLPDCAVVKAQASSNIWPTAPGLNVAPWLVGARRVIATMLAREGFRGPATVFRRPAWFYRSFGGANEYPFEKFGEPGRTWEIPKLDL
jgi:hypothetical protein